MLPDRGNDVRKRPSGKRQSEKVTLLLTFIYCLFIYCLFKNLSITERAWGDVVVKALHF